MKIATNYQPDIIITQGGFFASQSGAIAKKLNCKLVIRLGGHIYDEYRENISKLNKKPHYWLVFSTLKKADHIIVVTQEMKDKLCKESGRNSNTVSVIPVSINIKKYDQPKARKQNILSVINLNFKRKLQAMQDFLPALKDIPDLKVIAPGQYHNQLKVKGIKIHDFTEHIEKEYQKASVLCYFSYLDGCPNIILEAWASHTPVVVNRCSWSNELIQDRHTGLLVNNKEEAKLAVNWLLDNPKARTKIAKQAYDYLTKNHTEKVAGRRLGEVLRAII